MKAPVLAQKRYLLIKATAIFLGLVFAFAYSRELGVVNRSILAYVFTLSSLIWIFLTSGTTLTLRKNQPDVSSRTFASFQTLLLVQLLIGLFVFSLGLFLFLPLRLQSLDLYSLRVICILYLRVWQCCLLRHQLPTLISRLVGTWSS